MKVDIINHGIQGHQYFIPSEIFTGTGFTFEDALNEALDMASSHFSFEEMKKVEAQVDKLRDNEESSWIEFENVEQFINTLGLDNEDREIALHENYWFVGIRIDNS